MLEFRVTKYNPALRAENGAYLGDDWTAVSDIGETFDGVVLTNEEYERVERAYVMTALAFLHDCGISSLTVNGLENYFESPLAPSNGEQLSLPRIATTLSSLLREDFWCRLEGPDAFIHVGWDYYMYIGVPHASLAAEQLASNSGLFVEPFESPYKEEGEESDDSAA